MEKLIGVTMFVLLNFLFSMDMILERTAALFESEVQTRMRLANEEGFQRDVIERGIRTSPVFSRPTTSSFGSAVSGEVVSRPVLSDIVIPEIATGYEEIYRRFLRGRLIYKPDPNSDVGRIEMPFTALENPLEGVFDLSRCGNIRQCLSIATGYKKAQNPANAGKIEVWIAPKFLIQRELDSGMLGGRFTSASHFRNIMDSWQTTCPVGIFWTRGNDNTANDNYDYLTTETVDNISAIDLGENWKKSPRHVFALSSARKAELWATGRGGSEPWDVRMCLSFLFVN